MTICFGWMWNMNLGQLALTEKKDKSNLIIFFNLISLISLKIGVHCVTQVLQQMAIPSSQKWEFQ